MIFSQSLSGRRVFGKRVASVCSISLAALLAACSSQGISVSGSEPDGKVHRTGGAIPIPSEPVYGHQNSASNGLTSPVKLATPRPGALAATPVIQRTSLSPIQTVSNDASYAGSSYAMQPVIDQAPRNASSAPKGKRYAQSSGDYADDAGPDEQPGYNDEDRPRPPRYRGPREDHGDGHEEATVYTVVPGDTLYGVANRFRMSMAELAERNGLAGSTIYVGQTLKIGGPKYTAAHGYDREPREERETRDREPGGDEPGYAEEGRKAPPEQASYEDRPPSYQKRRSYNDHGPDQPSYDRGAYQAPRYNGPGEAEERPYRERPSYADHPSNEERREARGYDDRDEPRQDERYDRAEEPAQERYEPSPERYERPYDGPPRERRGDYRDERPVKQYRKPKGSYYGYAVRHGESLHEIARRNGLSQKELAEYNDIPPSASLYPGQVIQLPKGRRPDDRGRSDGDDGEAHSQRRGEPRYQEQGSNSRRVPFSQKAPAGEERDPRAERRVANAEPQKPLSEPKPERKAEPVPAPRSEPAAASSSEVPASMTPEQAGPAPAPSGEKLSQPILAAHRDVEPAKTEPAGPKECEAQLNSPVARSAQTFREPVQGLIVAKFGARKDGSFNDGVDFSVPKGTPVKAAENGVVAYVGSELSGFGNLVLVRHADGYVTAYAHNDEVLVTRCETVKRGQIISKAGASGNVAKPQLHFELRKDSKAVDPEAFFSRS
jgi:murein DD-endopeptidase MepM/ murein hydrolase activator NlpD